jgi:hypothetical protein
MSYISRIFTSSTLLAKICHTAPVTGLATIILFDFPKSLFLTNVIKSGCTADIAASFALVPFMTSQPQRCERDAPFCRFKGKSYYLLPPAVLQFNPIHKLRVQRVNSIRISLKEKED